MAFPLLVWAVWRLGHALVLVAFGGDLADDAFRFDGNWLLGILEHGYAVTDPSFETQQNVAFFPGLVWLTEPFSWLLGTRVAAILIGNVTGAAAFVAVFGALRSATGERIARRGVFGLALWPASMVMTAYYAEGLFLAMTAGAVWAAQRERHALAYPMVLVAALTRSIGFLLGPLLAAVRAIRLRRLDRVAVAYACSGPLGLAVVSATQAAQVDDGLAFLRAQKGWGREFSGPWVPIWRAADGIVEKLPRLALELGLNLAAMVLVGAALIAITRRFGAGSNHWHALGWGWAAWFAPLLTSLPSSQVRFALAAWPALAVVGDDSSDWG
ncbi:MAG: hypothetical protein ACRD0O_03590, partial [Acidimicrobiia bacterium]